MRCVDSYCFPPMRPNHPVILTPTCLQAGKVQSARIRVENIIRSDIATELHEILELYCELLLARSQLLEQAPTPSSASSSSSIPLDPALEEAVRSIIYAAPRTEIKELHTVRALLVEKFGKDVALASMEGEGVAERVVKKLKGEIPGEELVDAYLSEIARFYGVSYGPSSSQPTSTTSDDDEPGDAEAGLEGRTGGDDEKEEELVKATPPRKLGPQSPLRVVPPSPSTDNVAPKLKLPGKAAEKVARTEGKKKEDGLGKIPDVDELAKRFAQLKR